MSALPALLMPANMPSSPLSKRHRRVAFLPGSGPWHGHDAMTKASLAQSLARLLGLDYAGIAAADGTTVDTADTYFVPCDTLLRERARQLGIADADDLFGGVAPLPFVANKTITHPLVAPDAQAPEGWSPAFAQRVGGVVLDGCSAFNAADARRACARLLQGGTVRVKHAAGVGGSGQAVVGDLAEFDALLASADFADPWTDGLVLERNLHDVQTVSVGQVRVGHLLVSYHGTQRLTSNHRGHEVYGGSSLTLVRGGFEELLRGELPDSARCAVEQALVYHHAALHSFDGLFMSRSNYDVVQGRDDAGAWRSGVLEQSWRIGGASGAEIAALHLLAERPEQCWVKASTHEVYDEEFTPPPGAQLLFDGVDADAGRLLKYALIDADGDA